MSKVNAPKEFTVSNISQFVRALCEIRNHYRERNEFTGEQIKLFYRGQSNVSYELVPGLFRKVFPRLEFHEDDRFSMLENTKAKLAAEMLYNEASKSDSSYFDREVEIVRSIQNRYPDKITSNLDELDVLTLLQHYGAKTRLLDITPNSLVALYFAIDESLGADNDPQDGVVYIFPVGMDEVRKSLSDRGTLCALADPELYTAKTIKTANRKRKCRLTANDFRPMLVMPRFLSERQLAQNGYFFLFPNRVTRSGRISRKPANMNNSLVCKIIVPANAKEEIRSQLYWLFGMQRHRLFPDDVGVFAKDLIGLMEYSIKDGTGYLVNSQM